MGTLICAIKDLMGKLVFAIKLPRFCHVMMLVLIMLKHTLVPEAALQSNQTGHTVNLLKTPGVFNNLEE